MILHKSQFALSVRLGPRWESCKTMQRPVTTTENATPECIIFHDSKCMYVTQKNICIDSITRLNKLPPMAIRGGVPLYRVDFEWPVSLKQGVISSNFPKIGYDFEVRTASGPGGGTVYMSGHTYVLPDCSRFSNLNFHRPHFLNDNFTAPTFCLQTTSHYLSQCCSSFSHDMATLGPN